MNSLADQLATALTHGLSGSEPMSVNFKELVIYDQNKRSCVQMLVMDIPRVTMAMALVIFHVTMCEADNHISQVTVFCFAFQKMISKALVSFSCFNHIMIKKAVIL